METQTKQEREVSLSPVPSRALVTGGGGFLGEAVARRLVEQGCRVASLSRGHYPALDSLGVEQVRGDIADFDTVAKAAKGAEIVFHTAAKAGVWGKYEDFFRANVTGTRNVIKACLQNDVPRLIHTSSPSVVFDGTDMEDTNESVPYPERYLAHYPQTKAVAEREVRQASDKIGTICLRPHLIWGPGDNHLVPRILAKGRSGRLMRVGDGENLVDVVYIDNAADAHLLAAQKLSETPALSGNVYFISQDEPVKLWDMVDAILKAGGLPPVKRCVSPRNAYRIGAFLETSYKLLGISKEPPMTRFVAEELAKSHWFDISAAKRELGYIPEVSTARGLELLEESLHGA